MTHDAEAAASEPDARAPKRLPDLFGFAYLAIMGIVMTAWIGMLVWIACAAVNWLAS